MIGGAVAQLVCRKVQAVEAGDHTLYLGHIEEVQYGEAAPLLYFRGRYAQLG
ncbi:flavin reductase family protein [Deinococcus lacus]|uniref:Flavin reductase family protein n=1 Tax=Deinococcus lacus TaxID=392561 RepID=A0ABW1YDR1_9DEIO